MSRPTPLRFGAFLPPHHRIGRNATKQIHDDLDLMVLLDRLGFHEAWIGEHHSGGMEIISSPEVFIATAAERTKHIRLGTGVNTLPYHHPFILANRWVLLSHLTRGRAMFGAGPGQLPTDFWQMGLDLQTARRVMEDSLEAIVALLEGDGPVTRETETFTLRDAQLHIPPYDDQFDLRVAASFSPAGPRAAGRFGLGMISFGGTTPQGGEAIRSAWSTVQARATEFGRTVDRGRWALVGAMHLAETVEQAHRDVHHGMGDFLEFLGKATPSGLKAGRDDIPGAIDELTGEMGMAVIGTPDMAIETIERLQRESGGMGAFLLMVHEWADAAATRRSFELFAEHVMPHFDGTLERRRRAYDWMIGTGQAAIDQTNAARSRAQAEHDARDDA